MKKHKIDKQSGKLISNPEEVVSILKKFFKNKDSLFDDALKWCSHLRTIMEQLKGRVRFVSSSVLFVFDETDTSKLRCRMIDFAHVEYSPPPGDDAGVAYGMGRLCEMLGQLKLEAMAYE